MIALQTVERLAKEVGVAYQLHRWPDKSLSSESCMNRMASLSFVGTRMSALEIRGWLQQSWKRVSAWPK